MELNRAVDSELAEHLDILRGKHGIVGIGSGSEIHQATPLSLLHPLLRVVVAIENDAAVADVGITDKIIDGGREVSG